MRIRWAIGALALLCGCKATVLAQSRDSGSPGADSGTPGGDAGLPGGGDSGIPTQFNNVVDAVVVPMLLVNGLPVTAEDPNILCRRMAIDLTGITPTAAELSGICQQAPGAVADYFMNKPSYVWVNRRWWADSFQYQAGSGDASTHTFYSYVRDLDALVGQLYAGSIKYDEFTRRALASPSFARRFGIFDTNHDLIQIASQAFRIFLGREALPSEAQDFGNLWGGWSTSYWPSPPTLVAYPDCATIQAGKECYHSELGLNPSQCAGVNALSCTSTVLGTAQVIPPGTAFIAYDGGFPANVEALVEAPGQLLTAQPQWAEAAVDRSLEKYLGWWEAGVYVPDYEIPAVRQALAQFFATGGYDVRALDKEIVTSVLYTQQAALQPGEQTADPIWAYGPTKALYAEAWLDSLGQAVGKQLGGCDFRYAAWTYGGQVQGAQTFAVSPGIAATFYPSEAGLMGGCPVASPHGDPTGILPAATRRAVLVQLCAGAFPATASTPLMQLAQTQVAAVGRPGTASELTQIVNELQVPADGSCDPNNLSACAMQQVSDGLCNAVFASAAFTYY